MSILDFVFTSDDERRQAAGIVTEAIRADGREAARILGKRLEMPKGWKLRRVLRLAIDEVDWRQSCEWLPDHPSRVCSA